VAPLLWDSCHFHTATIGAYVVEINGHPVFTGNDVCHTLTSFACPISLLKMSPSCSRLNEQLATMNDFTRFTFV
jgi:hypothetical protein